MSDLHADGFKASDILAAINATFDAFTPAERTAQVRKTAAVFELRITNAQKQEAIWTIDLKDRGTVYKGPVRAPAKAGVTLLLSDDTFEQLATGKLDGQKAFMTGKFKAKGNVMLAIKLMAVLESTRGKAKL